MTPELLQTLTAELRDQLQNGKLQSPAYQAFLQAVKAAEQEMRLLHSPDRSGRLPTVDRFRRDGLMRLHQQIGAKAEGVLRGERDRTRTDLVRKITALAAGNHRALLTYEPEREPKPLSALLSEVRTLRVDTRGAALKSKLRSQANARQPITFLDNKGRETSGVFTPKTVMNVRERIQSKLDGIKVQVREPVGRQILDSFLDKLCAWGAARSRTDISRLPASRKLAMLAPFLQCIGAGDGLNRPDRDRLTQTMNEIFAQELRGADIGSKIPQKLLLELGQAVCGQAVQINANLNAGKLPDGARLDSRSAAVSAVADLLGVPNLIVRSRPMKLIMPDGSEAEGTFMAKARGFDPKNLPAEAAGIDRRAVQGSTEEERSFIGKGFKNLADLQIVDYLCGNVNRNGGNMLYQFTEGRKFCGVQGIDNECALGIAMSAEDRAETEMSALSDITAVSASMDNAVRALSPETLRFCLRGFGLSEEELDAAGRRLQTLQNKLEADRQLRMRGKGLTDGCIRVLQDDEWADCSMQELCRVKRAPDPTPEDPTRTALAPANIFATARAPICEMGKNYAEQREAAKQAGLPRRRGADDFSPAPAAASSAGPQPVAGIGR